MGTGVGCRVRLRSYRQTQARGESGAGDRRAECDPEPTVGFAVVYARPKNRDDAVARYDCTLYENWALDVTRSSAGRATHHLRKSCESGANARNRRGA